MHIYLSVVCITILSVVRKVKQQRQFCRCPQHEGVRGNRNIAPLILNLVTRRKGVVRFSSRTIYPRERNLVVIKQESVLTTERAGRSGDRMPVGARFSARQVRPWGPPSLLYNGYRRFPGGKVRPGRAADHLPPSSTEVLEE
jgi:hypothetical protein